MLKSFFEGALFIGLPMAFMFGPAFFALLQTTVQRNLRSGIFLAFGILLSDSTLVALSFLGVLQLLSAPSNQLLVGIVGGIILICFGIYSFSRKVHIDEDGNLNDNAIGVKTLGPFTYILKGFFLNIMNPFLFIWWIGMMSFVSSNYRFDQHSIIVFFAGALFTVFSTDVLKCMVARRIRKIFLKPKVITLINKGIGIILMVFGVVLIVRVLYDYFIN